MFTNRLKEYRERRELSQVELSRLTRIAASNLNAIERGRLLPLAKAKKRLVRVLRCSEEQLFPQETEGKARHYTEPPYDDIYFQAIDRMNSEEGGQTMDKPDMDFEALVDEERARQDLEWGVQNHSPVCWSTILSEEVGELASASLRHEFEGTRYGGGRQKDKDLEKELIQCAAVLKAMWESGKRNGWIEREDKP